MTVSMLAFAFVTVALVSSTRSAAQAPDTLQVAVDGHRMQLVVSGRGPVTIVLEAGASSTHRTWSAVQDSLARYARVVSYDRAGLGASDSCAQPRTARVVAQELHEALHQAGLPGPYLLVGWSLGGAFARVFAGLYPADVRGLVLVGPVSEDFYPRAEREHPDAFQEQDKEDTQRMVAGQQGERAELAAWDSSMAQAHASDGTFHRPVTVLTSPRTDLGPLGIIWVDEHRKWVARTPQAKQIMVNGVGHAIHRARPDIVVTAARGMLP